MTTTVTAKIQLRKGTAAQWTSANPTLLSAEIGYETDTDKIKIGDGVTAWTALAYYHDPDLVTDHGALTGLADDDHGQYHTDARGDARYTPIAHASNTSNPHSVTAVQVGADASGTAAGLIASHEGAADPHPGYALESALGGAALLNVGTTAGTVAAGDDARFATGNVGDAFASSHPGGNAHIDWTADQGATNLHAGNIPDISGTYAVAAKGVTNGDSHDHNGGDGAQIAYANLSGLPTLGTAAATASTDYATSGHTHAQLHDAVTISDTSSIDLTLTGQQISAAAIFGTTSGTVCQGDDARLQSLAMLHAAALSL